jgi:hypothetical protein
MSKSNASQAWAEKQVFTTGEAAQSLAADHHSML